LVLGDTDGKFYRRYLRGLTRDIRYLRYTMLDIADGVPRLQVLVDVLRLAVLGQPGAAHPRRDAKTLR
jgi:uncharacterized heparinase superfamily protein